QPALTHELLRDAEGKRPVQKNRHTGRLVLLHRQGRNGAGPHIWIDLMFHACALLVPTHTPSTVRMSSIAEAQEACRGRYIKKGARAGSLCCLPKPIPIQCPAARGRSRAPEDRSAPD